MFAILGINLLAKKLGNFYFLFNYSIKIYKLRIMLRSINNRKLDIFI